MGNPDNTDWTTYWDYFVIKREQEFFPNGKQSIDAYIPMLDNSKKRISLEQCYKEKMGNEYEKSRIGERTPFQVERDKIIAWHPFHKQSRKSAILLGEQDTARTYNRLIHVFTVASLANSLCQKLKLNQDLVEGISLGHDIGHVPFSHMGEYALRKWLLWVISRTDDFESEKWAKEFCLCENSKNQLSLIPGKIKQLNIKTPRDYDKIDELAKSVGPFLFSHGQHGVKLLVNYKKGYYFSGALLFGIWRHSRKLNDLVRDNENSDERFKCECEIKVENNKQILISLDNRDLTLETKIVRYIDDVVVVTLDLMYLLLFATTNSRGIIEEKIREILRENVSVKWRERMFKGLNKPELDYAPFYDYFLENIMIKDCDIFFSSCKHYYKDNCEGDCDNKEDCKKNLLNELTKVIENVAINEMERADYLACQKIYYLACYYWEKHKSFKNDVKYFCTKKHSIPPELYSKIDQLNPEKDIYRLASYIVDFISMLSEGEVKWLEESYL